MLSPPSSVFRSRTRTTPCALYWLRRRCTSV
jgi:hypothetical protein